MSALSTTTSHCGGRTETIIINMKLEKDNLKKVGLVNQILNGTASTMVCEEFTAYTEQGVD